MTVMKIFTLDRDAQAIGQYYITIMVLNNIYNVQFKLISAYPAYHVNYVH